MQQILQSSFPDKIYRYERDFYESKINEIYKIKRTSERYVGLIEDVLEDYNKIYKDYSDLVGIYLDDKIIGLVVLTNKPLNDKYSFTDLII